MLYMYKEQHLIVVWNYVMEFNVQQYITRLFGFYGHSRNMVDRLVVPIAGTKKGTPAISVLQQNGEDRHDVPVTGTTIL